MRVSGGARVGVQIMEFYQQMVYMNGYTLFLDKLFSVADVKLNSKYRPIFRAYTAHRVVCILYVVIHSNVTDTVKKLYMKRGHQIIFKIRIRYMDVIIASGSIAII